MSKLLTSARQALKMITNTNNLERLAKPVELVDACEKSGKLKFQFTVDESQINIQNSLHGAYIAFLVDHCTGISLALLGKTSNPGVSVDMSVSYLRSAKLNELITVETECKKVGSTLAFLEATFVNDAGKIIATARHTKYVGTQKYEGPRTW